VNKFVKFSVLPVAALAVACGRGKSADKDAALTADLKRDLAAASASGVELANSSDYQRTRVVSAIESPATSAPVRKRNVHKPVAHPASAGEGQVAKSPEPAIENKVEVAQPEPSTETPIPTVETPTTVAATPRPVPVGTAPASTDVGSGAVGGGSHGGGLGGIGEAIGTIIGVAVIRGGGGGIDHCDPRTDRRGGRGGFPILMPPGPGPRSGQVPRGPIPINP
jgi:hypothetical protein